MFRHYSRFGQAILVRVFFKKKNIEVLQEFKNLVTASGIKIFRVITVCRSSPHPKFYVGTGKIKEIAFLAKNNLIPVIIFDHILSPNQEKHLEDLCQCKIIDRTELILHIFSQRAKTSAGKLQVKLAQLRYLSTRLVHGWTHLEKQKGDIKRLRGPGETQLEVDRRLLRTQINHVLFRLKKVAKQREQERQSRARSNIPSVLLVGYTNVGKSTVFNLLTNSSVYIANKFFATLDPIHRRIAVHGIGEVILIDTVGFIKDFPSDLVSAFQVTLQEALYATLLLHIVDASDDQYEEKIAAVIHILDKIKIHHIPILTVMNKIDLLDDFKPRIDRDVDHYPTRVWISAKNTIGQALFIQTLSECLYGIMMQYELLLPPEAYYLNVKFYQMKVVQYCRIKPDGNFYLIIKLSIANWLKLCQQYSFLNKYLITNSSQRCL
ncbi:ribosome rescue GTPase HflX [Blochmannia endosymbiont of Camponotus (Colobopsis) obliquus]|uniref:ribosome rescue GTPase HflX n=1 Tax=Blochmannia endosymbiont of Camponotus (Colobopsis) obliquus TaxID=1505597 RepID=UPI00061A53FD|nr:ribosome rescue GTPase HflX [Blochmannia endosymbiont of Camponotus (Colobopsis) obliquus]AKC60259.1 GTPase HflX [Blochmannia endosymbiont of Camponotus (Colobopsis) obliquus]